MTLFDIFLPAGKKKIPCGQRPRLVFVDFKQWTVWVS